MKNPNEMSDVEKFFYAVQAKLGGNLRWEQLGPQEQFIFVNAVNVITMVCEIRG